MQEVALRQQLIDGFGVQYGPEGSGEQGKLEKKVALTTMGDRMMMMMMIQIYKKGCVDCQGVMQVGNTALRARFKPTLLHSSQSSMLTISLSKLADATALPPANNTGAYCLRGQCKVLQYSKSRSNQWSRRGRDVGSSGGKAPT